MSDSISSAKRSWVIARKVSSSQVPANSSKSVDIIDDKASIETDLGQFATGRRKKYITNIWHKYFFLCRIGKKEKGRKLEGKPKIMTEQKNKIQKKENPLSIFLRISRLWQDLYSQHIIFPWTKNNLSFKSMKYNIQYNIYIRAMYSIMLFQSNITQKINLPN